MLLHSSPAQSLSLFYCYAHEDSALRDELDTHLAQGPEPLRSNRDISEGGDWHAEMDARLEGADLLLLLVTDHLIASGYCDGVEMQEALRRHEAGELVIVPILLCPVDWEKTALRTLQPLPHDGQPVMDHEDRDEALAQITTEIHAMVEELLGGAPTLSAVPAIPIAPSSSASTETSVEPASEDEEAPTDTSELDPEKEPSLSSLDAPDATSSEPDQLIERADDSSSETLPTAPSELEPADENTLPPDIEPPLADSAESELVDVPTVPVSRVKASILASDSESEHTQESAAADVPTRPLATQSTLSFHSEPEPEPTDVPSGGEATQERRNPYKGLRAFTAAEAHDFFGRDAFIDKLALLIESMPTREKKGDPSSRLLAVIGPASTGKSSAVRAGLIPSLHEGGVFDSADWIYLDPIVPGEYPLEALARTLLAHFPEKDQQTVLDDLQYVAGLHSYAAQLIERAGTESTHVVLVIDQFEELFTLSKQEERRHFVNLLVNACTRQGGPLIVVLTLRTDYAARLTEYRGLAALARLHHATPTEPTQDELRAMIVQPVGQDAIGVGFEDGLMERLLADVQGLPEVLPQLQFTLYELFRRREESKLTLQAYGELGSVKQAIAQRAEQIYRALPSHEHRLATYTLFLNLVDPGTVEQGPALLRSKREDFKTDDPFLTQHMQESIAAFAEAGLLRLQDDGLDGSSVEISHEVVLRAWPRLAAWIRIAREDKLFQQTFTTDVAQWEQQERPGDRLYRGAQLKRAKTWATRHEPSKQEAAFLQASTTRRTRVLRNLAIGALLLLVLLGLGAGYYTTRTPSPLLVTNTSNAGTGSLRWCIDNAPPGSTITFDPRVRGIILLSGSSITTKEGRDLTIQGPGAGRLVIRSSGPHSALLVSEGSSLTLSGLSFQQSKLDDASVLSNNGILTLNNSVLAGNSSTSDGGAISSTDGMVTLNNSTITNNTSTGDGGGIHLFNGTLTLNNSTIAQNSASGRGGGVYISGGILTMNDSTIAGNGTKSNAGGGIYTYNSTLTLRNDTISDNSAPSNGGGIFSYDSTITLDKSTVFNNTTGSNGGGISVNTANDPTALHDYPVMLERSIIAGNHGEQGLDVSGTVVTQGYNLFEYFAGATFVDPQRVHATDREFNEFNDLHIDSVLDKNGGSTPTHALLQGSPAIDAIPLSACDLRTATTDQRGVRRPQGTACDIGAYEYQAH